MSFFQFAWVKSSSERYIKYLRKLGLKIGERTTIYSPRHSLIDVTMPFLIDIGDDVQITKGVTILTHGYDWSVLKHCYGDVLGSCGKVTIGNNVFIGVNSTILKGVTIGSNVIIGANSLVNKDIPDDCVAAGDPARVIMPVSEYYKRRKAAQAGEAKVRAIAYYNRYRTLPPKELFPEFFWLFEDRKNRLPESFDRMLLLTGNYQQSKEKYDNSSPQFENYEAFLKYCGLIDQKH